MRQLTLANVKPVLFDFLLEAQPAEMSDNPFEQNLPKLEDSTLLQASFNRDLGMDSLDFVLFCFELERKLGIRIDLSILSIDLGSKLTLARFLESVNHTLS